MKATPALGTMCLALVLVGLFVFSGFPLKPADAETRADQITLVVGGQDKMKTRNPLPALANDVWTSDVLGRVYDSIGQAKPDTDELVPYIVKGVDANENGIFDANEYGRFVKDAATDSLNVTAYYDFNGIYFHDGVQATPGDLFFSYQLQALNPRSNIDLRVLMDKAGKSGSNYTTTRWLWMTLTTKNWVGENLLLGHDSLRIAVNFRLQEPFSLFYRSTLTGYAMYPRHVWEDRGYRNDTSSSGCTMQDPCSVPNLHEDFGKAIYPEGDSRFGQGIPTTETLYKPFVYLKSDTPAIDSAEEWQLTDADVIGTGPFKFDNFNEVAAVSLVTKNTLFFTGRDEKTGEMIDSFVSTYIHQPYLDAISTKVYASATLGILALQSGEIDYYHWSVAPEYVPELINNPNIRIWSRPEPGFFYLAYNMRRPAMGMWNYGGGTEQYDIGLHFRRAVAHLIDKPTIVKDFLQGYGVPGVVPLNPQNVRFYNSSLTGYDFSVAQAITEMDLAHQYALWASTQPNGPNPTDAATWYTKDPGTGKYILPGIGTAEFNLWCPNADYDPVRANSCTMIANEMNNIGINVKAKPSAFSAITALINAHDFDMYILGWRIGGNDPDYFYSFFHSSNAASGQNYGGFNNETLDYILEESRKELDENKRVQLFQWAEGILAEKLPYDVLYFRTNIEAQRQDRFVGWMPSSGTIWNYWSLLNIKPPSNKRLSIGIEAPSAIASGDDQLVTISVKDQDGNAVASSNITIELTPNYAGNFTYGAVKNYSVSGQTNLAGKMTVHLLAGTFQNILNATITATATYPDFPDAGRSSLVAIYPVGANFLAVTVVLVDTDVVNAGDTLHFQVTVTDPNGFEKQDAAVTAALDQSLDAPAGVSPTAGVATDMRQLTFTAPVASKLPLDENPISLTITANYQDWYNGTATIGLVMVKLYKSCPDGSRIPNDETCKKTGIPGLEVTITIGIICSIAVVYAVVRRRRT